MKIRSFFQRSADYFLAKLATVYRAKDTRPTGLVWISFPRSGSTYLCDLLDSHPGIYACLEIFHWKRIHCREPQALIRLLNERFGLQLRSNDDPALIEFAHSQQRDYLEALRELSGDRLLSYKIFPNHLSRTQLRKWVLADRRSAKILFKRDLLAAYVSREKALKLKSWEFSDTTATRVSLNGRDFADFVRRTTEWFDSAERYLKASRQRYSVLDYEELTAIPDDGARLQYVVERIQSIGVDLASLDIVEADQVKVSRQKQDRSSSLSDKVENFDQFKQELKQFGLERFLL